MMSIANNSPYWPFALLIVCATFFLPHGIAAQIRVGGTTDRTVSPYLTGMNAVYAHEFMETWVDGRKIAALKQAGITCLRYPGGHVVSFWDWEFPYHPAYQNFWDPAYIEGLTPEKKSELKQRNGHRMGLDDFFQICADADLEPIVGINMFQGYKFDRLDDSVAKAVRLVEYCKRQKPHVKYYFLDNEAGHQPTKGKNIPVDDYIRLISAYSKAIKKAQPDAELIVNTTQWRRVGNIIKEAGEHFDIVDEHWYYSSGNWGIFRMDDWRREEKSRRFEERMRQFRDWKKDARHDHLKLGLLEWNLGPATGEEDSDRGTFLAQGLVQADMLMQFIDQDVFMAAAWPLMWAPPGKENTSGFRNFFDHGTGEASSARHIFRWFSMAGNGAVLDCKSPTAEGIHAASVMQEGGRVILVYLLNKSEDDRNITVELQRPFAVVSAQSFQEGTAAGTAVVKRLQTRHAGQAVAFHMADTSLVFLELAIDQPETGATR